MYYLHRSIAFVRVYVDVLTCDCACTVCVPFFFFFSVASVTGTLYGVAMTNEYEVTAYRHALNASLFIFIAYDDVHYKMTAVDLRSIPSSPTDKYVTTSENIVLDASVVSAMWDGTYSGYTTTTGSWDGRKYEVKNVAVHGCSSTTGLCCGSVLWMWMDADACTHFGLLRRKAAQHAQLIMAMCIIVSVFSFACSHSTQHKSTHPSTTLSKLRPRRRWRGQSEFHVLV